MRSRTFAHLTLRIATTVALSAALLVGPIAPAGAATGGLLVDSFATQPPVAVAGGEFTLSIVVANHADRRAEDVQVTIGAAGTSSGAADGGAVASGIVVVGTGNTKRVGRIAIDESEVVTFTLAADPTTAAGVRPIPVSIAYTVGGVPRQMDQELGVRVTRLSRLEVTSFEAPAKVEAGQEYDVIAEVMNTGESNAAGVTLSLAVDGVPAEGGSRVVGILNSGDLDVLETTLEAPESGEVTLVLTTAYVDPLGETHDSTETATVKVTEPESAPEQDAKGGGFWAGVASFFKSLFGLGD
jgi:hypothetical protein